MAEGTANGGMISQCWDDRYWWEDQLVVGDQLMAEGTANGGWISCGREEQLIMGGSADGGRKR
jgi:hypothetical protein